MNYSKLSSILVGASVVFALLYTDSVSANCDVKHLLTRLDGAMNSGVIDGSILTYGVRERFTSAFLADCPSIGQKISKPHLSSLLEKMTAGWESKKLNWKSSIHENYYELKKSGIVSDLNQVDEVVTSISTNDSGICEAEEVMNRFMTIGDCTKHHSPGFTSDYTSTHLCLTSVETRKSAYVRYQDLCPHIKFRWEDIREIVVASKQAVGMMERPIRYSNQRTAGGTWYRDGLYANYKATLIYQVRATWNKLEEAKRK